MTSSVLSPLAPAFYPSIKMHFHLYDSSEFVVYSGGMPVLVPKEEDGSALFHSLTDETIEDAFPPTADEIAELEEVDSFTEVLAELSLLEEVEEKARSSFNHIKKRWETRRSEGLIGRPKPIVIDDWKMQHSSRHGQSSSREIDLRSSISRKNYDNVIKKAQKKEERMHLAVPKNTRGFHHSKPIHQPRKF